MDIEGGVEVDIEGGMWRVEVGIEGLRKILMGGGSR